MASFPPLADQDQGDALHPDYASYEGFVSETLEPRLKQLLQTREELQQEDEEYEKVLQHIESGIFSNISNPHETLTTWVDIGASVAVAAQPVEARITSMFIHVGEGVFVEKSIEDAEDISKERQILLSRKTELIDNDISNVVNDIESALTIIAQLRGLKV
jgi:prefoldin subunit 5